MTMTTTKLKKTKMSEAIFAEQKARVRRLLRRLGWTFHLDARNNDCMYAKAAKRDAYGIWRGAYIAAAHHLQNMTDEDIIRKIPDVA